MNTKYESYINILQYTNILYIFATEIKDNSLIYLILKIF